MKLASFNQGTTPTIVCQNLATVPLGCDFTALVAAMQKQVNDDFAPHWGTPCNLEIGKPQPGCWLMVFLDNADQAGALGYHDLTPDGLPLSKVFVKTTLADKSEVSVTASHELQEMLVDPAINMLVIDTKGKTARAYEVSDPVEETFYAVNGINLSNFVLPSYFEDFRKAKSVKFDQMGLVTKPLQLLKGGYQSVYKNGKWSQIFGSLAKSKRFAKEDRRGHRSESRGKPLKRARKVA